MSKPVLWGHLRLMGALQESGPTGLVTSSGGAGLYYWGSLPVSLLSAWQGAGLQEAINKAFLP